MPSWLMGLLATMVAGLVSSWLVAVRARRRRAEAARGETVSVPIRVRGREPDYPAQWRRGRIDLRTLVWRSLPPRRQSFDLSGFEILRMFLGDENFLRGVFVGLARDGARVDLSVGADDVRLVHDAFTGGILAPPERPAGGATRAPTVAPGELTYDRVAAVIVGRARLEEWPEPEADPESGPELSWSTAARSWSRVPERRRAILSRLGGVTAGFVLTAGLVAANSGWLWTALVLATGDSVVATATVTDVTDNDIDLPFVPADAFVRFDPGTGSIEADAPVRGTVHTGDVLRIRYAAGDHHRVRVISPGHDGLLRGVGATLLVAVVGLGPFLHQVVTTIRWLSAMRGRFRGPGRPVRYVILPDSEDGDGVVLFPRVGDAGPVVLVPLLDKARGVLPVTGLADAHGELRPDELVALRVGSRALWPSGPAAAAEPDAVAAAVNGTLIDLDDPSGQSDLEGLG